ESGNMRHAWRGVWQDLNWIGIENPAALPHTAALTWFLLGDNPVAFSKFHVPIALLGLGLSLWICLRQFGFRHAVCGLAAIAAALNMNTFSHSTWGLPSRAWTLASAFLAIAALRSGVIRQPWLKALLAGFAVANGIMEGFDVGAIFSLYVGAFAVFIVLAQSGASTGVKLARGIGQAVVVALFAAICAAAALSTLIGTQIKGVAGMGQDSATKNQRWDAATMWSLPKVETLRVMIPGLFGYRMDAEEGRNYWGAVGQSPGHPQTRHSGAGEYAGVLVILLAAFGVANAFRKKNSPYTDLERRTVLFFAVAALVSVLFAWGRHAPFYQIIYSLPFFSTIRNPIKFMHPFHMAFLILFGFGLEALFRLYVKQAETKAQGLLAAIKSWRAAAPDFERKWAFGLIAFAAAFLLGTLVYISSRRDLLGHLATAGFTSVDAEAIARASYAEVFRALAHIVVAVALLIAALSGWFSGRRARILVGIIGALLIIDLVPANKPWVVYYDYKQRYASNPIIDFLKENAHEHRVTARYAPFSSQHLVDQSTAMFMSVANMWLQHHFQYYNVQSLEPVQMPRPPALDEQFFTTLLPGGTRPITTLSRMWELSNTRYLLGDRRVIESLNSQVDGGRNRIRIVKAFEMAPKPGANADRLTIDDLDWARNENGRFAIGEFTGALPRVKLFPSWQIATNDQAVLVQLASPQFDPTAMAFLNGETALTPANSPNFMGEAKITRYSPKQIEVTVSNNVPVLMVYNDKYSPNWRVTVNGKDEILHRANYIMRGVPLAAGQHTVTMRYSQPMTGLYVSLVGMAVGLGVLGFVAVTGRRNRNEPPSEGSRSTVKPKA
ncbi:MAG: YfhO family protein, partial [Limisphaerales bacterium]